MKVTVSSFLIISVCILSITGCTKENREFKQAKSSIKGEWELRKMIPTLIAPIDYPAGNGNKLIFSEDHYEKYEDGVFEKSGGYQLTKDPSVSESVCLTIPDGEFEHRVIYEGDDSPRKTFVDVNGDKLRIVTGCFAIDSGAEYEYVRINAH